MKMQQNANAWKEDKKRQVETFCNKMSIKIRRCKPRGAKEKQQTFTLMVNRTNFRFNFIIFSRLKLD